MNTLVLTIPGKPIAKKRPRFARRGKFVTTYNDQETEESRFIWELKAQLNGKYIEQGQRIFLQCVFHMPYPKSMSKKKREANLYPTTKPDLDNLIKFTKDCCNGILWHDDSQVVSIKAIKLYAEIPSTELEVNWE